MELDKIVEYIKNNLSEKRFKHSVGVMNMCEKLAKIYDADVEKAKKIGIVHDMAKEMTNEELLNYIDENNLKLTQEERTMTYLFHGIVAADIAKKKFSFDREMELAVAYHTTSKPAMTILQKILFVSDKIEENRTYSDVEYYRNLAYNDIDECILKILDYQIKNDIETNRTIPQKSIESRNYILINFKK